MHHLMSLKLVSSSFNVVPISLNGSRRIKTITNDGDTVTNDSLLDTYAKREKYIQTIPDIMALNFIHFATKYKLVNNKLTVQPHIHGGDTDTRAACTRTRYRCVRTHTRYSCLRIKIVVCACPPGEPAISLAGYWA